MSFDNFCCILNFSFLVIVTFCSFIFGGRWIKPSIVLAKDIVAAPLSISVKLLVSSLMVSIHMSGEIDCAYWLSWAFFACKAYFIDWGFDWTHFSLLIIFWIFHLLYNRKLKWLPITTWNKSLLFTSSLLLRDTSCSRGPRHDTSQRYVLKRSFKKILPIGYVL